MKTNLKLKPPTQNEDPGQIGPSHSAAGVPPSSGAATCVCNHRMPNRERPVISSLLRPGDGRTPEDPRRQTRGATLCKPLQPNARLCKVKNSQPEPDHAPRPQTQFHGHPAARLVHCSLGELCTIWLVTRHLSLVTGYGATISDEKSLKNARNPSKSGHVQFRIYRTHQTSFRFKNVLNMDKSLALQLSWNNIIRFKQLNCRGAFVPFGRR
jgi:hypothetical protein